MDSLIHELTGATRTENDGELSRVGCYLFCSANIVVHGVQRVSGKAKLRREIGEALVNGLVGGGQASDHHALVRHHCHTTAAGC